MMDSFYVSLLSLFVLVISFSLHFLFFSKHKPSSAPLPPGRTGWPIIGESLEFISTGWKGHPEKFIFDRISKHSSSVFRTHLLGEKAAVLCGAHGNKFLFSSENTLVQVWWPSSVDKIFPSSPTISSSKEEGIKMRKMLVPVFLKPEALQRFVGAMDQVARNHFSNRWENKDSVLVFPLAKNYIFSVACRLILSIEDPVRVEKFSEPFQVLAAGLFTVPLNLPGTPFNRSIKASGFIRKELVEIIKQRRSDLVEGKDLLSDLLVMSDENGKFMGDLEMADKILSLLIAAHDTTSSTCTSVVKYLAELPEIYEGVYKEQMAIVESKKVEEALNWDDIQKMKYSWNVACEVLRLAPPLQGAFREAITDFVFNGFSIPKGWKLYWSANSTHRNPECFPEPLKFDPSRFDGSGPAPYTFVPFGGGPRMCPGKEFSRLEILVFMHHLVKRFRWEKIIPDEKTFYNPMPSPAEGLPVRLYPHSPN